MSVHFGSVSGMSRQRNQRWVLVYCGGIIFCNALFFAAIFITRSNSDATKNFREEPKIDAPPGTVALVVTDSEVPAGTRITAAQLRKVPWPVDSVPPGAARTVEEVENKFAVADLQGSLPILRSALSITAPAFGIERKLPQGYRAIAISVTATTSIEARATAGAHVDVLLTYTDPKDGQIATMLVAENAVVMSFGGEAAAPDRDDSIRTAADMQVSTATLAVPFNDTLRIQTALAMGRISLALRPKEEVTTQVDRIFRGLDFGERSSRLLPPQQKSKRDGYVRYTDANGQQQEMRLNEQGWQTNSLEDTF